MKNILCALFLMIISVNVVFAYDVNYDECTNLNKAGCSSNESCIWNDDTGCYLNECAKLSTEHGCKHKAKCSWENEKCRLRCSSTNSTNCKNEGGCYWSNNTCNSCPSGYYCPSGSNNIIKCGTDITAAHQAYFSGIYTTVSVEEDDEGCTVTWTKPGPISSGTISCISAIKDTTGRDKSVPWASSHYACVNSPHEVNCAMNCRSSAWNWNAQKCGDTEDGNMGTYWMVAGCVQCQVGEYCPIGELKSYDCGEGQACSEGTIFPSPCPDNATCSDGTIKCHIGYRRDSATNKCVKCEAGTYSNKLLNATYTCTTCDIGYYCPEAGMTAPKKCPDDVSCSSETIVPDGYQYNQQKHELSKCDAGYYCKNGTYNKCSDGNYCLQGSSEGTPCKTLATAPYCPKGTKCPPGYYCGKDYKYTPTPCDEGYVCRINSEQQTLCKDASGVAEECKGGNYCTSPMGTSNPVLCAISEAGCKDKPGYYWAAEFECSDVTDQSDCKAIPTCTWKREAATQNEQLECQMLYDGAENVVNYIDECKNKEFCVINHLAACAPLTSEGCHPKTVTQKCQPCPQGYYCIGNGDAEKCPGKGHSTESTGSDSYDDCGIFCNVYNDEKMGEYKQGFCKAAPGCYWDNGSCEKCDKGYYCGANNENKIKCPLNSTSDEGATERTECYHDSTTKITASGNAYFSLPAPIQIMYEYPVTYIEVTWPEVSCDVQLPVTTEGFCK